MATKKGSQKSSKETGEEGRKKEVNQPRQTETGDAMSVPLSASA